MKWFHDKKIRVLVQSHPEAQEALAGMGIRCATCTRHDCKVSQIAESEELTMDQEIELMQKLEKAFGESE